PVVTGLVASRPFGDRLTDDPDRESGRIALSSEHSDEPSQQRLTRPATLGPQLAVDQRSSGGGLLVWIELIQRGPQRLGVDALLAQLGRQRPAREAAAVVAAAHPGAGKGAVVDDPHLCVPGQ